jgi:hypothetical protein
MAQALDVPLEPDPVIDAYKRDVDRTLLLENLRLTPEQRYRKHAAAVAFLLELRKARPVASAQEGARAST